MGGLGPFCREKLEVGFHLKLFGIRRMMRRMMRRMTRRKRRRKRRKMRKRRWDIAKRHVTTHDNS